MWPDGGCNWPWWIQKRQNSGKHSLIKYKKIKQFEVISCFIVNLLLDIWTFFYSLIISVIANFKYQTLIWEKKYLQESKKKKLHFTHAHILIKLMYDIFIFNFFKPQKSNKIKSLNGMMIWIFNKKNSCKFCRRFVHTI